jgi:hypothetical protein
MATKAGHGFARAQATLVEELNGIPALTPEELDELIDSPEPVDAHVEPGELHE